MEKIKKIWNSFKTLIKKKKNKKLNCSARTAVRSALVLGTLAIGFCACGRERPEISGKQQESEPGQSTHKTDRGEDDDDDDPARQIPCGYAGVIEGILSTKGLTTTYRALGTSCEHVLVGQRLITSEVVSKLDLGENLVQTLADIDDQSWQLASATPMSDRDYENLLAIVEAEAGGEDVDGRIMVANVILNRVKEDSFPGDVTSVIWDRTGGSPQFSPTADGRIYDINISDTTREAVNRAIDGEDLSRGALYFVSPSGAEDDNVKWFNKNLTFLFEHGGHMFYR